MRLFAHLTGRRLSATARPPVKPLPPQTAARLAAAVQPTATPAQTGEPLEPTQRLTAVVRPGKTNLPPGAYTVTYSRITQTSGERIPAPEPLRTRALDARGLAALIANDARRYIDTTGVIEAFVDVQAMGGHLHVSGRPVATFKVFPTRKARTTTTTTAAQDGAPTA